MVKDKNLEIELKKLDKVFWLLLGFVLTIVNLGLSQMQKYDDSLIMGIFIAGLLFFLLVISILTITKKYDDLKKQ